MGIRKHIPNALTCCNLLCGMLAIVFGGNWPSSIVALVFILLAAFFDFLDGLAARSLKAYSPIGKDLDSLADMVSFGVAPAYVGFHYVSTLATRAFGDINWAIRFFFGDEGLPPVGSSKPFVIGNSEPYLSLSGGSVTLVLVCMILPLLLAVFSALRLAKFNNDKRQSENFIGLATPACAILYVALISCLYFVFLTELITSNWVYWIPVAIVPILCWLLVSEIPMFSMKIKNFSWQDNRTRFLFLMIVAVEIVMAIIGGFMFSSLLVAVITTYIILNLLIQAFRKKRSGDGALFEK